jgi:Ca-activated chloride channel family protein
MPRTLFRPGNFCYNRAMDFAWPMALFLLVLAPLFALLAWFNYAKKRRLLRQFLSEAAEEKNVVRGGREIDFFKAILVTLALAFLALALARPRWGERFENIDIRGLEIAFLLDTSTSMQAEDLKPDRLEVAKGLIAQISDTLHTDLVSLINFAGVAYVQCPLTSDYEAFKLLCQASAISPEEEQGTDFEKPFSLALRGFARARGSQKLVVLITDGEDLENRWQAPLDQFRKMGIVVFTVGVGLPGGAPIPVHASGSAIADWKKDKNGQMVRSTLDESTLIRIASATSGQYFRLNDASAGDRFTEMLKAYERKLLAQKVRSRKVERFYVPLLLAALLLIAEMMLSDRKLSWKKS